MKGIVKLNSETNSSHHSITKGQNSKNRRFLKCCKCSSTTLKRDVEVGWYQRGNRVQKAGFKIKTYCPRCKPKTQFTQAVKEFEGHAK